MKTLYALHLDRLRTVHGVCVERGIELRLPSVEISSNAPGGYLVHLHRMQRHLCHGLTVEFESRLPHQRTTPSTTLDLDNLQYLDLSCPKPEESMPVLSTAMMSPAEQAEAFLEALRSVPKLAHLNLHTLPEDVDVPHLVRYIGRAIVAGRFPALRRLGGVVPCRKEVIPKSIMQQMQREVSKVCRDKSIKSSLCFEFTGGVTA